MNSFGSHATLTFQNQSLAIARLDVLEKRGWNIAGLPYCLRILLENLLRLEDGKNVTASDIETLALRSEVKEISFMPARVLLQDFTGVPAVVDLAAMRDAMKRMGGDPKKINPLQPVELVIDHSVQVDAFGSSLAFEINSQKEFSRNRERYAFLRWGQKAFNNFKVVPPDTGIVHQVNLEYLARVVMSEKKPDGKTWVAPDTLVGTDSHTTMINGLGVLGWGVGGIEAEAVMLGQSLSLLIPEVVGFQLKGTLKEGITATDLVLTVTELLRKKGVVGKFVEFFGEGITHLTLADRATIANMAPEYGATCGFFPVDEKTLQYLQITGRPAEQVSLVETYLKEQGLFWTRHSPDPEYTDRLTLDLSSVETSLAGPSRPQDRAPLSQVKISFEKVKASLKPKDASKTTQNLTQDPPIQAPTISDGSIVIAAITSCTNTSNPSVMMAAGLLAKKAVERGLRTPPWVKTSLAPGSMVVTDYLKAAGLLTSLEQLNFHLVGYGCTTCIGNSGPLLDDQMSQTIKSSGLVVVSVLSGNRNFEGRIHPEVRANYLASPPLVVAYALAGRINIDLTTEPVGQDSLGKPVFLKDIWPTQDEIAEVVRKSVKAEMFQKRYGNVYEGDERWRSLKVAEADTYPWDDSSTYVRNPPYFDDMPREPSPIGDINHARVLAVFGDSITTDHISPAGMIKKDSPAGHYLQNLGVNPVDFNSYGSRRGNHEVMKRGTFANTRIKNRLAPGTEGGVTLYLPEQQIMPIYDAALRYQKDLVPLVILAGKEYGSGSSRDWAAKGPMLLGVRVVIAESYERIHRSNLVGMGILPLEFQGGDTAEKLGLTGHETFEFRGLAENLSHGKKERRVTVVADQVQFPAKIRIDTPQEIEYYRHGGILPFVLRRLLS